MVTKRLVVLANSVRHAPQRCVAGREVLKDQQSVELGGWVRPVSVHGQGELYEAEIRLEDRSQPGILDVVDVPLDEAAPATHQPDNWRIKRRGQWRKVGQMSRSYLPHLEEQPPNLWLAGERSDRIAVETVEKQPPTQSLYLIRPRNLRLRFWSEPIPDSENEACKRKRRAVFEYRGMEYDLSLTDSRLTKQFEAQIPAPDEPRLETPPDCGDVCLLCLSLTTAYRGQHYKVVATVIPL